ncbi:hypothetical protein [Kitasatospora sp. LaBMicrA B282]|uniref:hypothetical protein n=1 Tax=Kitasatospora sp. LaBMicrA B282 TaxID=3420949 RepID=UPI003D0C405A
MTSNPGSGFVVHPDALTGAGQNAQTVGGRIPEEAKGVGPASDAGVAGLAGFASAQALQECTAAWQGVLNALAGELGGQGQNLVTTAQNYRSADASAAAALPAPAGGGDPFAVPRPAAAGGGDPFAIPRPAAPPPVRDPFAVAGPAGGR